MGHSFLLFLLMASYLSRDPVPTTRRRERSSSTAPVVPARGRTRGSEPRADPRDPEGAAVQRPPARRAPRPRLPDDPAPSGSPPEESTDLEAGGRCVCSALLPLSDPRGELRDLRGGPSEGPSAGGRVRRDCGIRPSLREPKGACEWLTSS